MSLRGLSCGNGGEEIKKGDKEAGGRYKMVVAMDSTKVLVHLPSLELALGMILMRPHGWSRCESTGDSQYR